MAHYATAAAAAAVPAHHGRMSSAAPAHRTAASTTTNGEALVVDSDHAPPVDVRDSPTTTSPITSPPYWTFEERRLSSRSVESLLPGHITLQDNTDGSDPKNEACWARGVVIEDYVLVDGNRGGWGGAFVAWNVLVETLNGTRLRIRKRYSEFDELNRRLRQTFPLARAALPPLPPKSVVAKMRAKFLEQRRIKLQYYLNCIILNPEFSGSPVMKDFLFA